MGISQKWHVKPVSWEKEKEYNLSSRKERMKRIETILQNYWDQRHVERQNVTNIGEELFLKEIYNSWWIR